VADIESVSLPQAWLEWSEAQSPADRMAQDGLRAERDRQRCAVGRSFGLDEVWWLPPAVEGVRSDGDTC